MTVMLVLQQLCLCQITRVGQLFDSTCRCCLYTVTDIVDKHLLNTSAEIPSDSRLRLTGARAPSTNFMSDGSAATLSASSTIQPSW